MTDTRSYPADDHASLAAAPSRRAALNVLLAAGAGLAVAGAASSAVAGDKSDHEGSHSGMDHSKMDHSKMGPAKWQDAVDKALVCVNRGEVCLAHCIEMLGAGDTSMKGCMASVSAMLPLCAGLARLAALDAARLKDYAKVCADVCADCEKECRKHEKDHAVCKACAESCADCIKACKAIIDA